MLLYNLEPILYLSCTTLMIIPILLFVYYIFLGQAYRIEQIMSFFRGEKKVSDLIVYHKDVDSDMALGEFIKLKYEKAHSFKNYLLPLLLFHIVYFLGLYYSSISFAYLLHGGEGVIWMNHDHKILDISIFASAGFMGSTLLVIVHLFWRTVRNDLQPRAFIHCTLRLVAAPILALTIVKGLSFGLKTQNVILFIGFGIGFFTDSAIRLMEQRWHKIVGLKNQPKRTLPLKKLQGLEKNDELRLWEEGITDAEHLAVETVQNLLINTNYSLERIIDWKDQAFLYIYVEDDIEKWRRLHMRGAMDILGLEARYFGKERFEAIRKALAKEFNKDDAFIERFVNTIFNDPRVHQLWNYLTCAYPASVASPIIQNQEKNIMAPDIKTNI